MRDFATASHSQPNKREVKCKLYGNTRKSETHFALFILRLQQQPR